VRAGAFHGGARALGASLAAALALAAAPAEGEPTGRIEGSVSLAVEGVPLAGLLPIVVYVQPERAEGEPVPAPAKAEIRQQNAHFTPEFSVVTRGQNITMPNDDDIDHNVYSASENNRFDLGIYEAGQVRSVKLQHPGQVDIHCSIHESMNATVFVSPTPWYARVAADGRFAIDGLEPGRYRLRTWSKRLPRAEMFLRVRPGEAVPAHVVIGAPTASDSGAARSASPGGR